MQGGKAGDPVKVIHTGAEGVISKVEHHPTCRGVDTVTVLFPDGKQKTYHSLELDSVEVKQKPSTGR